MQETSSAVLLFDLGGVLIENQMFSELQRLMGSKLNEAELIQMWLKNPAARQFELGRCSPDEFAKSIIQQFGLPLDERTFLAAFKGWPKGFYVGAESMLAELRSKYRVCCLSNSNEIHWSRAITDHFEFALSSHLMGCIKPDRDAFEHALGAIGVDPDKVYYFDDAPMNVEAASTCGMHAHHTVGYDQLRSTLAELGFLSLNQTSLGNN